MKSHQARLIESFEIAPEVKHFVFEVPELESMPFTPGQFVSLVAERNGKKITRAYSLAAPPRGNQFELCLNRVENGLLSPYLFELKPGDEIEMKPPLGGFVWKLPPPREVVYVATGTGIAPFRSMLLDDVAHGMPRPVTLLFGVRYETSLMYRKEFEAAAAQYPQFRFWPTLSRPELGWTGRTGHVQKHLPEAIGDRRDLDVFVCGMKAMVDDVRQMLKDWGFDRKQIVYEKYD